MTNEEKINEIVNTMKAEAENLDFCFDCVTKNAVCFACGWIADWKDVNFAQSRQALIDKACNEFSNFLYEMKEIWWKGDNCDESVKFHWLISFRKVMEETK